MAKQAYRIDGSIKTATARVAALRRQFAATHGGRFWRHTSECGIQRSERGYRKAMKVGSLALAVVALYALAGAYGIRSAVATDFCIELTTTEFNRRTERRGDDNACAGSHSSSIKAKARDRARDNASNAIAPQCLRNVTPVIAQRACTRVNLVANTSVNNLWANSPPAPKPSADKVRYIGHGIGSAAGVNLCVVAHDIRLRTHNAVDGHCPHDRALLPHRTFATARAWARCSVICRTP
jgi:hypothetical protein